MLVFNGMEVEPTGKRENLKDCNVNRRIYKVVDYRNKKIRFTDDLIYLYPNDKPKQEK